MPVVSPWRICQGAVKSIAIVRKELEPIARTELFGTVVKLGPHFTDVQPSLDDSLPVIEVKGKSGGQVYLRCDGTTPLISLGKLRSAENGSGAQCAFSHTARPW